MGEEVATTYVKIPYMYLGGRTDFNTRQINQDCR
jgi:hypothetical protein